MIKVCIGMRDPSQDASHQQDHSILRFADPKRNLENPTVTGTGSIPRFTIKQIQEHTVLLMDKNLANHQGCIQTS